METRKPSSDAPLHTEQSKFSRTNRLLLGFGMVLLAVGFLVLSQANEAANNCAGLLSPLLILGAYAAIFISLIYHSPK
jgi:dipeptide/tripeptide permease